MNCEQIQNNLTAYLLKDVNETVTAEIRAHLDKCAGCRATAREIEPTLDLLRDALATGSKAQERLSELRHSTILRASKRQTVRLPKLIKWLPSADSRIQLYKVAAILVLLLVFAGMLLPARMGSRERARRVQSPMKDNINGKLLSRVAADYSDEIFKEESLEPATRETRRDMTGFVPDEPVYGETVAVKSPIINGTYASRKSRPEQDNVTTIYMGGETKHDGAGDSDQAELRLAGEQVTTRKLLAGARLGFKAKSPAASSLIGRLLTRKQSEPKDQRQSLPEGQELEMLREYSEEDVFGDESSLATEGNLLVGIMADKNGVETLSETDITFSKDGDGVGNVEKGGAEEAPGSGSSLRIRGGGDDFIALDADVRERDEDAEWRDDYIALDAAPDLHNEEDQEYKYYESVPPDRVQSAEQNIEKAQEELVVARGRISELRFGSTKAQKKQSAGLPVSRLQTIPEDREDIFARKYKKEPEDEPPTGPKFKAAGVNPFFAATDKPFSTFAIDVDTAAYTLARNYMAQGLLPPAESVRTEEFINFFDYAYNAPKHETFRIYTECAPSKFGHGLNMLKIGVKGRRLGREEQRQAVLTFLIDTSGSMNQPDRLGLVKKSLRMLVEQLAPHDLVAIIQYDSHARLVIEHTPATQKERILQAIDNIQCSGSTNLEEGMQRAYGIAAGSFVSGGENRVLLLSDGVANLGTAAAEDILGQVQACRKQGIYCSVFGFGIGTYDDTMLETLANKGNGTYTFIDSESEAKRVFVDDLAATLNTIASDVKIQVEFNPNHVKRYRQLGYENRQLKKEDFRNDTVDAGEIGSGQSVTALYEIELAAGRREMTQGPIAVVRVRYRRTDNGKVEEIERTITDVDIGRRFDEASARFRLAAAVAEYAEILRNCPHAAGSDYNDVAEILRPVALELHLDGKVQELLRMIEASEGMARGNF